MDHPPSPPIAPRPERLLLVDDDPYTLRVIRVQLGKAGFHNIVTTTSSLDAIGLLQTERFDVLLLDMEMPGADGVEVLQQLQDRETFPHQPLIIMLSSNEDVDRTIYCFQLGVNDYHRKPLEWKLLTFRINALLEQRRLQMRLQEELNEARALQMSMMRIDFAEVTADLPVAAYADMHPAEAVGGDFFDYFMIDDATLCFAVGDVSDKGIPAALFMARTKSLLRSVADPAGSKRREAPTPELILSRLNQELRRDNARTMFVTLFLGLLTPRDGRLRFANAGHPGPYRWTPGGAPSRLEGPHGRPLGLRANSVYTGAETKLTDGETLFVFSDGVTDAVNARDEFYGEQRLIAQLAAHGAADPATLVAAIRADVDSYAQGCRQYDDITVLALRLGAVPPPA